MARHPRELTLGPGDEAMERRVLLSTYTVTTLGDLDPATVDMRCLLLIGSSQTRIGPAGIGPATAPPSQRKAMELTGIHHVTDFRSGHAKIVVRTLCSDPIGLLKIS